jgi:hypothetical protein
MVVKGQTHQRSERSTFGVLGFETHEPGVDLAGAEPELPAVTRSCSGPDPERNYIAV